MILSRTAAAACSARFACSSDTMTSLNEISGLPDAKALAFSFAEEMASSRRWIAVLRASEKDAPGAPEAPESTACGDGTPDSEETDDSAEMTPATAVIMGIMVPL